MVSPREGKPRPTILRGGRLRKTARGVLTYAPWLGLVSALAMGASFALTGHATADAETEYGDIPVSGIVHIPSGDLATEYGGEAPVENSADTSASTETPAGGCAPVDGSYGGLNRIVCSGTITTTQNLTASTWRRLIVTDEDGTHFHVASGAALVIRDRSGTEAVIDADITAAANGIDVAHQGTATITANGEISAGGKGMKIASDRDIGNTIVAANGDITAGAEGIYASRINGIGDISITAAAIDSEGDGIAAAASGIGDISVTAAGAIDSEGDGIDIANRGSGSLSVTAFGVITAGGRGIDANNEIGPGNSTITTGDITAGAEGIFASHSVIGDINITTNGDIAAAGNGIYASHSTIGDIFITTYGDIASERDGIVVQQGPGDISVTAHGDITADEGIYAKLSGIGDIDITANGDITAEAEGIYASHNSIGDITITTSGDIVAYDEGIYVSHTTIGDLSVTAYGDIASERGDGIAVRARASGDISITVGGAVAGVDRGVDVHHRNIGDVAVTVNAGSIISGESGTAIQMRGITSAVTQTLDIDSATLIGGIQIDRVPVSVAHVTVNIAGTVSITGASNIEGTWNNAAGTLSFDNDNTTDILEVADFVGGGALTLNVNFDDSAADRLDVSERIGAAVRIDVVGSGAIANLDAGGVTLVGAPEDGRANAFTLGSVTLNGAAVEDHGLTLSRDSASGDWFLRAAAPVELAPGCHGVDSTFVCQGAITETQSLAAGIGEKLTVTDEDGTSFNVADGHAVELRNVAGSLGMEVSVTGNIKAKKDGIYALADAGDVSITAEGIISSNEEGIYAWNRGAAGALTITANGEITSTEDEGIEVQHDGTGDIDITANAAIASKLEGIEVDHDGDGDITITANGNITSKRKGIDADHDGDGHITITANGNITAYGEGIEADHDGDGDITITANGNITTNWEGIGADQDRDGDITIVVNAGVTISSDGDTVSMKGGTAQTLNLDSATLIGGISATGAASAAVNIKGTVSITGTSVIEGEVDKFIATLSFDNDNTTDRLAATSFRTRSGSLVLNVDFAAGADTADRLVISEGVYGSAVTHIDIVGTGSVADLDAAGLTLIDGPARLGYDPFTLGSVTLNGVVGWGEDHGIALRRDETTGDWKLVAAAPPPVATAKCAGTGGTFLCSGVADPAADVTQRLTAGSGERLVVTDETGFGIHVAAGDGATTASGNAFIVTGESGSTGMEITLDGDISAIAHGIRARHDGTGAVEVATRGDISTLEGRGIDVATGARSTSLTITAEGAVSGGDDDTWAAIRAEHGGTGPVFVNAAHAGIGDVGVRTLSYGPRSEGRISGGENGIFVRHQGQQDSAIDITANGRISATANGIKARHQGDGDIIIDANGDIADARNGIYAKHRGDRGDVVVNVNGDITAERKGVEARHRRAGDLRVSTAAGSSITSDWKGIEARHRGNTGNVIVTAEGNITAGWKGIEARVVKGQGDLTVTAAGTISGGRKGVEVRHQNNGAIDIATSGAIRDSRRGVEARHHSTGNIDIRAGGSISARNLGVYARHTGSEGRVSIVVPAGAEIVGARKNGIRVSAGESNSIEVDVAGSVGGKQAVFLRGGESQRLILRPGFALVGGARGEGATLELTGESEDVLDFDAVEFAGFADLVKSGSGVWELTGEQLEKQGGRSAVVEEGVLRFSDLRFTMNAGSAFSVGENGVLELQGKNILDGGLKNRGSISFAEGNTASTLEVTGNWDGGGTLTFNADLEAGTANALVIGGDAGGTTRVSLRTSGSLDKGKGEAVEVIRVHGSAANDAFSGEGVSGALRYKLVADGAGAWRFHVVGDAPGAPAAEAYAGALAVVAQPASVMERFGEGYWRTEARVGGGSASLVADVSETSSRFGVAGIRSDMSENRARAGVLVPMGDVLFGAEMWQGAAQSRVSSALGGGEIGIASHAALLSATWLAPNGFYADTQAQYARFVGSLQTGGAALASGNDGAGASASAELGWRLDVSALAGLDALRVAPQAQVTWSRIGFEDFSAPDGLHVSLEDGVTAAARLGLAWEGEWRDLAGIGRIHGGINLHEPLDGTTTVNISGISFANEQRDLGLDATLGFGYEWADGYSLNLETTTAHQNNAEEYGVNLGVQIEF